MGEFGEEEDSAIITTILVELGDKQYGEYFGLGGGGLVLLACCPGGYLFGEHPIRQAGRGREGG